MRSTPIRKLLISSMLIMGLAPAVPGLTASSLGKISLQDPITQSAYADVVPIAWNWQSGSKVTSGSAVYFQASPDGYRWFPIKTGVPIRSGETDWDTTGWPEGFYSVRGVVHRTLIMDVVDPIVVDRTAPGVRITKPSEGDVWVEDTIRVYGTAVVGTTTLEADTHDYGTGVETLVWTLNGEEIGRGSPYTYNFSLNPGRHTLTATATDHAGNESSHSILLIAGPGPSLVAEDLPEVPEAPEPPEGPGEPGEPGELPEAPDPSGYLPEEDPTVPDPTVPEPTVPEPPSGGEEPPSLPSTGEEPPSAPPLPDGIPTAP
jgi:hypothetical protein